MKFGCQGSAKGAVGFGEAALTLLDLDAISFQAPPPPVVLNLVPHKNN